MFRLRSTQSSGQRGPVARVLATLLLIVAAATALFFGAILVVILLSFAIVVFIVLYLRAWWLRRKLGLNLHPRHHKHHDDGVTLEGEYTVNAPGDDKSKRQP